MEVLVMADKSCRNLDRYDDHYCTELKREVTDNDCYRCPYKR